MATHHKPEGYNALSPYFIVYNAPQWIEDMQHVFGAEVLRKTVTDDGRIHHAELKIEDSVMMVAQATDIFPSHVLMVHLYVTDAIAVFNRALDYGFKPLEKPENSPEDGDIRGSFLDRYGNYWFVASQRQ